MSVGANLRQLREAVHMTQTELAQRVNVSVPMICQIERGSKTMSISLGAEIAAVLGCELSDLVKAG